VKNRGGHFQLAKVVSLNRLGVVNLSGFSNVADDAAILDVRSTSKGVLLPRLTDEQRNALYRDVPQGMLIFNTTDQQFQFFLDNKWYPLSVDTPEDAPTETVTDYDGNIYSVMIGDQKWMAENLRTIHYADGTALIDGEGVGNVTLDYTTKYYFWYNDDSTTNAETYGALYTWAAIMNGSGSSNNNPSNVQGVCPDGWHLPSDEEWTELTDYLTNNGYGYEGSGVDIAKSMASTSGWTTYGTAGTIGNDQISNNNSGFTAVPGGMRDVNSFDDLENGTTFWSATEGGSSRAWARGLGYVNSIVGRGDDRQNLGYSVRCIQD